MGLRVAGASIACLLLLQVALRAAGSLTIERGRETLDALLTAPLDSTSILVAKWHGSIARAWRGLFWLGTVWLTAYLLGGMELLAVPLVLLGWLVYAAFFAMLGLWFSITSRTTLQA